VGFGGDIHPRSGSEIIGRLGAAVQHDDQWNGLPVIAGRDIQFVWTGSRLVGESPGQEIRGIAGGLCWLEQPVDDPGIQRAADGGSGRHAEHTLQHGGGVGQATGFGETCCLPQVLR
jgi:hypothetical protein